MFISLDERIKQLQEKIVNQIKVIVDNDKWVEELTRQYPGENPPITQDAKLRAWEYRAQLEKMKKELKKLQLEKSMYARGYNGHFAMAFRQSGIK